jgi:hypothetical protein
MLDESRVEGCLVREFVEWNALVRALGEILLVEPSGIRAFDAAPSTDPRPPILVEIHDHQVGFRMDLTFYLGKEVRTSLTGTSLARRLAMTLGQEILTSPPARADGTVSPPDLWVLARPDGSLFLVHQCDPESEDVEIDCDPARMKPLPEAEGGKSL